MAFLDLPTEIMFQVVSNLGMWRKRSLNVIETRSTTDIASLSCVSKKLRAVTMPALFEVIHFRLSLYSNGTAIPFDFRAKEELYSEAVLRLLALPSVTSLVK